MIEGILSGEKRRRQVIIAFTDKHPQERILRHRAAQCFRHVHVAVFVWLVVPRPKYDPSLAAIVGPYTATFNDYVRGDLKFESDLFYEYLTGRVRQIGRAHV